MFLIEINTKNDNIYLYYPEKRDDSAKHNEIVIYGVRFLFFKLGIRCARIPEYGAAYIGCGLI